jgi:hypothetical protein
MDVFSLEFKERHRIASKIAHKKTAQDSSTVRNIL